MSCDFDDETSRSNWVKFKLVNYFEILRHDLPVKMEKVGECICWRGGLVEMVLEQ